MRGRFSPKGLTEVAAMAERGVHHTIDLRSDTVTQPSEAMRRAMMVAEVGDDVYGEDPTVNRLEKQAGALFGREAALLVPTGTMANQIAVHLHTRPGQEVVCEARSHLFNLEMGMAAAFSGVQLWPVASGSGRLSWALVESAVHRQDLINHAATGLVVVENTHNWAGGVVTPLAMSAALVRELHAREVAVHLDGARIFNAAEALGVGVRELAENYDSLMFCLSKGLGAPVGSVLVGDGEFIGRARRVRKMLGGGMRQAGVLAAAGLVALEQGPPQLATDHQHARVLAEGLATIEGVKVQTPESNIVMMDVSRTEFTAPHVVSKVAERNVLVSALSPAEIRLVTHCDVDRAGCEEAVFSLRAVIERG
ncbi:MAG: threonine aldolase family protein [Terriglobales bacterium]